MDVNELFGILSEGISGDDAKQLRLLMDRQGTKEKLAALREKKDIDAVTASAAKVAELEAALDGVDAQGNPKGYRAWYNKHSAAINDYVSKVEGYEAKYGPGSLQKALEGHPPNGNSTPPASPGGVSLDDIRKLVMSTIGETYSPTWSNLVKGTAAIMQKHILGGRKNMMDIDAIGQLARDKYSGNMELAYDEWDKPERERLAAEAAKQKELDTEKEIEKRVNEKLAQRRASELFPGSADLTPSSLTERSKAELERFDKNALTRDLFSAFVQAGSEAPTQ